MDIEMKYKAKADVLELQERYKASISKFVEYSCCFGHIRLLQGLRDLIILQSHWADDEKTEVNEIYNGLNNNISALHLIERVEYMNKEQERKDAMETIGTVAQLIARPWEDALRETQKVADKPNFLVRIRTRISKFIPNRFKRVNDGIH